MLLAIHAEFGAAGIDFALDSGTMLGVVRDGHLLEHDTDNDILILRRDYEAVQALKTQFHDKYGYHMYRPGDYVLATHLVRIFKMEEFLNYHLAINMCGRIYDSYHWYYTDILCDVEVPASELDSVIDTYHFPRPITNDTTYVHTAYIGRVIPR